jgi:Xaa-Pro aminopeptidase
MHQQEFAKRRRQFLSMVGRGGVAILPAAPERARNKDTLYPYRQDSDFYYLTGFDEPDAVAVFVPGRAEGEFLMFCRDRDRTREQWDGPRAGQEGAIAQFGADQALTIADVDEILPAMLEQSERIYYSVGSHAEFDQRLLGWLGQLRSRGQAAHVPDELVALDHLLHEMRLIKSRREVAAMRRAGKIAVEAHRRAMTTVRPGWYEYQLEAELGYVFRRENSVPSYPAIVAAGANACVLHYVVNNQRIQDGDLILIDAGCEYDMYASDVTRTFPVNGRFTAAQRDIYSIVAEAQAAGIDKARPGNHWNDPHDAAVKVITRGLRDVGILKGRLPSLIKSEAYRPYFMHRTGHWLGMDVHDVGDYKVDDQWRLLEAGMVMTVEPGIYLPVGRRGLAKKWHGIGVRIEDDVLVTHGEPEMLTAGLPTTADEVETFMATAR